MIDVAYVRLMARYNAWQNRSLYAAADTLDEAARRAHRGAFFNSIHATLNHLYWVDEMWLSRFAGTPRPAGSIPESLAVFEDWAELKEARVSFDEFSQHWADNLDPAWLAGDLTWYSGIAKKDRSAPKQLLVLHLINHQTHHRGQVHAMLTQAGAMPEATDLLLLSR